MESCCRNAAGEMAGVTAPFFTALIRDSCQCERRESRGRERRSGVEETSGDGGGGPAVLGRVEARIRIIYFFTLLKLTVPKKGY